MWGSGLRWMFLIMGTMIGAGYASGREIWQFFGVDSILAIILFALMFGISCHVIMTISFEHQTQHYMPVLQALLGKKLTGVYDIMIILYLFTTTMIMMAGGGASLEMMKVPYWPGIAIIGGLVILLFFRDVEGVLSMNTFILPVLITLLVTVLAVFFFSGGAGIPISWSTQRHWPSALTFTAFNVLPLIAVLSAVGGGIKRKGEIWIASIGSGTVLGAISLLYNQSLLKVSNDMMVYEIPLFAILKHYPYFMIVVMSALLWFAIYTTAVSGVFGLVSRIRSVLHWPAWLLAFVIIAAMTPLTSFGFSKLIEVLYPIYGVLNLYILAAILIYPIAKRYELS